MSEQLSFWELINRHKIDIPIIQRDYAQGRMEEEKVRTGFLDALYDALTVKPTELDFVYGSLSNQALSPLDGQQRLTTLFLLHWYAAVKSNALHDASPLLKRFSYETRASARDFCVRLVDHEFIDGDEILSEEIKDANWFFKSWGKDPTVSAMLTMIDCIHDKFRHEDGLWEKLIDASNRPITFQFIELKNFGLSDDLYIKMNARGKQLSPFENFKASFEQYIEEEQWDIDKELLQTFSHKADTIWTDLFWRTVDYDLFDSAFSQFIANSLICSLAQSNKAGTETRGREIQSLFNNPEEIDQERFGKKAYKYLCDGLDLYAIFPIDTLNIKLSIWQQYLPKVSTLLPTVLNKDRATWPIRVLFFAQTQYLLSNSEVDVELFSDWMRVARNIVQNSTIDSAEAFIGAVGLLTRLTEGCSDIYTFLSANKIESRFAGAQVREEIVKATLILSNNSHKDAIFRAEDTNFCKGRVSFLFYCVDFEDGIGKFDLEKFTGITELVEKHFAGYDISNEFRRGLLTIEDGCFYNYWWSYLHAAGAPKRCLIADIEDLKLFAYDRRWNGQFEFRGYLKKLLCALLHKDLPDLLSEFECPTEFPSWKRKLISESRWLELSQKHYIAISDNNKFCYLIPQKKVANTQDGYDKLELIG